MGGGGGGGGSERSKVEDTVSHPQNNIKEMGDPASAKQLA